MKKLGVRTGASLVRDGVTGIVVERLPPGRTCVENDRDEAALDVFMRSVRHAMEMNRGSVPATAAEEFDTERIVDRMVESLEASRERRG